MLRQADLMKAMETWVADHEADIGAHAFAVELTESPEDRDPASVRLFSNRKRGWVS